MLYLGRFCMKNVIFAQKSKFLRKTKKYEEAETIGLYKTAYCI